MVVDFRRGQGRGSGLHMVAVLAESGTSVCLRSAL